MSIPLGTTDECKKSGLVFYVIESQDGAVLEWSFAESTWYSMPHKLHDFYDEVKEIECGREQFEQLPIVAEKLAKNDVYWSKVNNCYVWINHDEQYSDDWLNGAWALYQEIHK